MLQLENILIQQQDFRLTANWSVAPAEKIAVIGPSGAGKSTLLAAIAGFVDLQSGRILVNGQDITGLAPGKRPVSLLFQDHNLFAHLTVAQNVGLGLSRHLRLSKTDLHKVDAALERVGLAGMAARKPATLSGGQQSRAALARILLMRRPVVLMDEPFGALGPGLKSEMLTLVVNSLRDSGAALILVTHDPKDALQIADRTVLLSEGVAAEPVETRALFAHPPEALQTYLG